MSEMSCIGKGESLRQKDSNDWEDF